MVQQLQLGAPGSDNASTTAEPFTSLEQVQEVALECRKCGLCSTRTQVVFADGNPKAQLMIIGEAPGQQEDITGMPFAGRAGQLFDKVLASARIDRKTETYICYTVKCRPPNNRVPTPAETLVCSPFLEAQIELVKPKLILLAGATAVQTLLKVKEPISRIRGKWFDLKKGARVMPIFHPSYLLRNDSREVGSPKWLMWQDIREVRRALDAINQDA